jgi:hypothetical protein
VSIVLYDRSNIVATTDELFVTTQLNGSRVKAVINSLPQSRAEWLRIRQARLHNVKSPLARHSKVAGTAQGNLLELIRIIFGMCLDHKRQNHWWFRDKVRLDLIPTRLCNAVWNFLFWQIEEYEERYGAAQFMTKRIVIEWIFDLQPRQMFSCWESVLPRPRNSTVVPPVLTVSKAWDTQHGLIYGAFYRSCRMNWRLAG